MYIGGPGTRSPYMNSTIAYVKKAYPKLRYLVTVCTGSTIAARAGVLDGKKATGNKAAWNFTVTSGKLSCSLLGLYHTNPLLSGPNVDWVPVARWVNDGNVWTTSGVSAGKSLHFTGGRECSTFAGMDGFLAFLGNTWGEETASKALFSMI